MCQGENSYFHDDFCVKVHISITHDGRSLPINIKNIFCKSPHPSAQVGGGMANFFLTEASAR